MRSIFISLCAAAAVCVLPNQQAEANHYSQLRIAACDYADAAELFHRSLCRCRRGTDYAERLAEKLSCSANDLNDAVRRGASPRKIAYLYDEVFVLHDRLNELLGSGCRRPDRTVLAYWLPLDAAFERLVCAVEGCAPVCPLVSRHRPGVGGAAAVSPPVFVPPGLPSSPWFGPGFGGLPQSSNFGGQPFGHHDGFRSDSRSFQNPGQFNQGFGYGRDNSGFRDGRFEGSLRDRDVDTGSNNAFKRDRDRYDYDRNNEIRRAQSPEDTRAAVVRSLLSRIFD